MQAQKLKSNSTVDGVLCVVSMPLMLTTTFLMKSFMFQWVMQEIGWNGLDGTAVLQFLLILIKSLRPPTSLAPLVTLSLDRTALSQESCA